jgi:transposase-like protein
MVPQVWGRLRPQAPQATAEARRHLDLDEVFLRINGELHYLWRAVDQPGVVLDILVQERQNATAAKRFFKRLLAGLKYKPRRLVNGRPAQLWRSTTRTPARGAASDKQAPEQPS